MSAWWLPLLGYSTRVYEIAPAMLDSGARKARQALALSVLPGLTF